MYDYELYETIADYVEEKGIIYNIKTIILRCCRHRRHHDTSIVTIHTKKAKSRNKGFVL